jgi:hypothetical protein
LGNFLQFAADFLHSPRLLLAALVAEQLADAP